MNNFNLGQHPITSREQEVLHLIAHEHSSKEIASKLYVSHETVNSHRRNMMDKLGVRNTAGLIRVAFERGLMRVGQAVCMLMFFMSLNIDVSAQELAGLKYNYEVHSIGGWMKYNEGSSEEEVTWLTAACHDTNNQLDWLFEFDGRGNTSCGTDIKCSILNADCSNGCSTTWDEKLLSVSNKSDTEFDYQYSAWEDDDDDSATVDRCRENNDDYGHRRRDRFVAKDLGSASQWSPTQTSSASTSDSNTKLKSVWRFAKGNRSDPISFGELSSQKWHVNSNRGAPFRADTNMGYSDDWTIKPSRDVTYTFTIPSGGKSVQFSTDWSETNFDTYIRVLKSDESTVVASASNNLSGSNSKAVIDFIALCAGSYIVVVEGETSSASGDFDLTLSVGPISILPGKVASAKEFVCGGEDLGAINNSTSASSSEFNVNQSGYKWYRQRSNQNHPGDLIPNETRSFLPSLAAGKMPEDENVNWVRFHRSQEYCGANTVFTPSEQINKTNSESDAGSISFKGDTKTIPDDNTNPPDVDFSFPLITDPSTSSGYFDSRFINGSSQNSSGSPGPITTVYQLLKPGATDWIDVHTLVSSNARWTPDDDDDNPFNVRGEYRVRRKATNSCGKTDYSNELEIDIRAIGDLGSITGFVKTTRAAAVAGVTVTAERTSGVEGGGYTTTTYTAQTDADGRYEITGLYYGSDADMAEYTVTPTYIVNGTVHEFAPQNRTTNISVGSKTKTQVNFTDETSLSISGTVFQSFDPDGAGFIDCGMDTVTILVDGLPVDSTESDGTFNISVDAPGEYDIIAQYKNHTFQLDNAGNVNNGKIVVQSNIENLDFRSTDTHIVSGKLTDGCGAPIGEGTIRFQDNNGCWTKDIVTINNGEFEAALPARGYKIFVNAHPDDLVTQFFSKAQSIDLSERDTADYLLKYRAQPVVTLSGFPVDIGCSGEYELVPEMKQLGKYAYTLEIKELALDDDTDLNNTPPPNTCPVDTGIIKMIDAIGDRGLVDIPFSNGMAFDTIIAGGPNLIAPHLKKIAITAMDTVSNTADSEDMVVDVLVTGSRSTASNFDLVTPELPMMILRDPPGDGSYAFVEQEQTHEVTTAMYSLKGGSNNKWGNVRIGTQFEAGFIGFDVETKIWNDQTLEITHGSRNTSTTESVETTTVSSRFQTSDSDLIVGGDGDLIIGASMVMNYSTADIVSLEGCNVELSKELIVAPKGVKTQYFLRTGFIRDVTIPSLEYKVENPPNPDSIPFYVDQVKIWKNILLYNDSLKNNSVPFESSTIPGNLTLSDNAGVEYSVTSSSSKVFTTEFVTEIDKDIANEIGLEIAGIGASGGYLINMKTEKGETNATSTTETFTSGFSLFDDDIGDGFNISVKSDPVFKTPVFILNSGQTSCPWEPGTQKRDDPQLIALDPIQSNIPDGTTRTFNFELGNVSETSETREYRVEFINQSNSGARIEFENNVSQEYEVASGNTANVKVNISQFSNPSSEFSFEGLEFEAVPTCDAEEEISDNALVSAFYQNPCTDVTMSVPGEDWVINSNMTTIPIQINGYTKPGLAEIQLEYLEVGTYDWTNALVIQASELPENDPDGPNLGKTIQFDASNLPDGNYYLRLKAVCTGGINNYSMRVKGVRDTKAPAILGLPLPADDIFDTNDELIGTQFDEVVKPKNLSNAVLEFLRLDDADGNKGELPATLGLIGNNATITPQQFLIGQGINPGAYRVVLKGIEDLYGNVAEPLSWVFITPGYVLDDGCSVLEIANNNNNQDAISVSAYRAISISSDGKIFGAGETSYMATEEVSLLSNFEVSSGGEFVADIYPCDEDLCEDVTSSTGQGDAPGEFLRWQIVEDGKCVSGIYFDNAAPPSADIEVDVNQFVGATSDIVEVQLRMGNNQETINLTSTGATVALGNYVSGGGTLYRVEAILDYVDNRDANGKIVIATIKMYILPPDVTPPSITIDPIDGDNVVDSIDAFSDLMITGTTDAEDFQVVNVALNGANYNGQVTMGTWSVVVPTVDVQALDNGSITLTADVSDFSGNPAPQGSGAFTKNNSLPTQYPISSISYYDELMDPFYPGPSSPPGQDMPKLIDGDITTKFLSFDQTYFDDGFQEEVDVEGTIEVVLDLTTEETPSRLSVTTAEDEPDRDPNVLYILGSNDGVTFDYLAEAIPISCGTDRLTTRVYDIDNTTPYRYYVVQFLNQCNSSANSMQLAEVALWGN